MAAEDNLSGQKRSLFCRLACILQNQPSIEDKPDNFESKAQDEEQEPCMGDDKQDVRERQHEHHHAHRIESLLRCPAILLCIHDNHFLQNQKRLSRSATASSAARSATGHSSVSTTSTGSSSSGPFSKTEYRRLPLVQFSLRRSPDR